MGAAARPARIAPSGGHQLGMSPSDLESTQDIPFAPFHSVSNSHQLSCHSNEITPLISGICSPPQPQKPIRQHTSITAGHTVRQCAQLSGQVPETVWGPVISNSPVLFRLGFHRCRPEPGVRSRLWERTKADYFSPKNHEKSRKKSDVDQIRHFRCR
jgi:hypothetical protein